MNVMPIIFENTKEGKLSYDIFSRLLADRIIFLDEAVTDISASVVVSQLLYLEAKNPEEDICLYINSGGGQVTSGMGIVDVMNYIKCDVCTVCFGVAASMAAVILSSGTKGKRLAFPNSEIMIHQVKGGKWGQSSDVVIHATRIEEMNSNLINILAKNCGRPYNELKRDTDRDNFMSSEQALEYGLIDKII